MATLAIQRPLPGQGISGNLAATGSFGPMPVAGRRLSVVAQWTGTPTGTFSLEATWDGGATWQTVPGAAAEFTANSQTQPGGSASSAVWNWSNVPGNMVRLRYTASGGTGQLNGRFAWGD